MRSENERPSDRSKLPEPNDSIAGTTLERKAEELVKWITDKAISGVPPLSSAEELATEYVLDEAYTNADDRVDSLINWECSKNFAAGFITGLGGVMAMPVAIPAALGASWILQARMAAAIARIYGHSLDEDKVRTFVLLTLLGGEAMEILRQVGVKVGNRITLELIKKIPGRTLIAINKKVGFRLLTKAGQKGMINLAKLVPVAGGVVGGTVDLLACQAVGRIAKKVFRPTPDRDVKQPQYRVFYCLYDEEAELSADNATPMDVPDVYADLLGRLTTDGDYLGIIDDDGNTLQMMYQADEDCYWVEIPSPENCGSYGCYMDLVHLVYLMETLPSRLAPEAIPGLVFKAW
jgi:uncharacterized protein (DUF697 family)